MPTRPSASRPSFPIALMLPALLAFGPASADGMSAANRAHLVVADSDTLGFFVYVDTACELSDAAVGGLMQGVMSGRGLVAEADRYSPEGLNLELSLSCMEPDADGLALFSVDAAFSLVQPDESDLLVNHTYGTYGEGDRRFIADTVLEVIQEALNDFDSANERIDEPAAATPAPPASAPDARAVTRRAI